MSSKPQSRSEALHVGALHVEFLIADTHSLKEKRAVVKPIVEGLRRRFGVSVAEIDHQDVWQRSAIGVAAVGGSVAHVGDLLDAAERFVWSFPEITVLDIDRHWLETD